MLPGHAVVWFGRQGTFWVWVVVAMTEPRTGAVAGPDTRYRVTVKGWFQPVGSVHGPGLV